MDALLAALEASGLAQTLRGGRWSYAAVNAGHVLGVALLVGSIAPLDLRLMGLWRRVPLEPLAAVLRRTAAAGAALALATGALLFATAAPDYAATPLFAVKMVLIGLGAVNAVLLAGPRLVAADPARQAFAGATSLVLWLGALVCGRMLGYL